MTMVPRVWEESAKTTEEGTINFINHFITTKPLDKRTKNTIKILRKSLVTYYALWRIRRNTGG